MSRSAFVFLIHAHDYVWACKEIPLHERIEACALIWRAAITLPPKAEVIT